MSRRRAAIALLLAAGCGGAGNSDAPPAPIRLLADGRCTAQWPAAATELPAAVTQVEIGSVPAPGRVGRIIMHRPEDSVDARVALVAPAGSRYQASISLPRRNPVLQVGLGNLPAPTALGAALRFRVRLTAEAGESIELLDESLVMAEDGQWSDHEVSLAAWAGRQVRLELATEGPPGPLLWGAWSAPEVFERDPQPEGWNVVLVVLDTLRADHLGSYGYGRPTSPQLDTLAAESIRFATAVSQSSWTRPSHRSLFSGLYPLSRGGLSSPPLAEVLWRHGYRTQAITGGAQLRYEFGFSRGFESHAIARWVRSTEQVVKTLEADRSRRHFVFLHTYEIHDPYEHAELAQGMDPGRLGAVFRRAGLARLGKQPTEAEKKYVEALYDSGIRFTDEQLGRLVSRLRERGLLDRTLLIVTSDHGEELWDHGQWGHGRAMYDEQSRVPLIVHVPGPMRAALALPEGPRVVRQQVRLVDLYPTILDLLGIPLDHPIHGRSLRPLLAGLRLPTVEAFSESVYWGPMEVKALRSERYKYLRGIPKNPNKPGRPGWEALFDLAQDPAETVEIQDANRAMLARMRLLVDRIVQAGPAAREEEVPDRLDAELKAELEALGYLD